MAHNDRLRDPGFWILGSVVDPAEFEAFDDGRYLSIHEGGGSWAPVEQIVLGGAGLAINGPCEGTWTGAGIVLHEALTVEGANNINLGGTAILSAQSGTTILVQSGASFALAAGSTATVGQDLKWLSGASATFEGSTTALFKASSSLLFKGVMSVQDSGVLTIASDGIQNVSGLLHLLNGSTTDVQSGATLRVKSGATLQVDDGSTIKGIWNFGVLSQINVLAATTVNFASASVLDLSGLLNLNAGSATTVHGDIDIKSDSTLLLRGPVTAKSGGALSVEAGFDTLWDGDITFEGIFSLSSAGRIVLRNHDLPSGSNATVDARDGDIFWVPALAADRTYTLRETSPEPEDGDWCWIRRPNAADGHTVTIKSGSTTLDNVVTSFSWLMTFKDGSWQVVMSTI